MSNRWKDWFEQAKRDLQRASLDVRYEYYEWACFTSQQAAEKAIKALGLKLGLSLWGHSLTEMLELLSATTDVPDTIKENAQLLDLYYIPPRYPNGFAAGKPADYFTQKQAKEAIDAASAILRFCEGYFPQSS
ncbi:MAG: HEPN domain-containing protein [Anaerolineales bacterium]